MSRLDPVSTVSNTIAIVGLGLMGGSLAKAIKQNHVAENIIGVTRNQAVAIQAQNLGVITSCQSLEVGVSQADLIVLCLPISTILDVLPKISTRVKKDSIVIDVGSTKSEICKVGRQYLGDRFVGCHPMTGSEKTGFANSRADLFQGMTCFVTDTTEKSWNVRKFWNDLGSESIGISAEEHDKLVAFLSHWIHLSAFISTLMLKDQIPLGLSMRIAGRLNPSVRESIRLSKSDSVIWTDIFASNKAAILETIRQFEKILEKYRDILSKDITLADNDPLIPKLNALIRQSGFVAQDLMPDNHSE